MRPVRYGMKTRKRIQSPFAHPDISWSRNRSVMIVKRIQIQTTKRKISTTRSRSSPKLMSARGTLLPFESIDCNAGIDRCKGELYLSGRTLQHQCVKHGGDRGGEVQARYPVSHRQGDPAVRFGEE